MQLSKLQKHALKTIKNREKLKYLSLGIPQTLPIITPQKKTQKLINLDSCIHIKNSSQVLLTQFNNQLPEESVNRKVNRFYAVFLRRVYKKVNEEEDMENSKKGKQCNEKGYQAEELIDNLQKLTKLDDIIQKMRARNDKKFISLLTNCMVAIYNEADKVQQIKKFKITKLQKQIQKLYVQSHNNYLKLMQVKSIIDETTKIIVTQPQLQQQNQPLNQGQSIPISIPTSQNKQQSILQSQQNKDKRRRRSKSKIQRIPADQKLLKQYESVNNKINNIKKIIENREEEERKFVDAEKSIAFEKVQFLRLLLRNGYYQLDGIWWILAKLAKNNQKIGLSDINNILDTTTKKHVISQHQCLTKQLHHKKQVPTLPKIKQLPKQKQKHNKSQYQSLQNITYSRLINISSQENGLKIYKQAKSYIVDWVRQERWKIRSLKHKSVESAKDDGHDWKEKEIQRLRAAYPKQMYEKMFVYMFGTYKPTKGSHSFMFYLKDNKRKQSISTLQDLTPSSQSALRSVQHLSRTNTNK